LFYLDVSTDLQPFNHSDYMGFFFYLLVKHTHTHSQTHTNTHTNKHTQNTDLSRRRTIWSSALRARISLRADTTSNTHTDTHTHTHTLTHLHTHSQTHRHTHRTLTYPDPPAEERYGPQPCELGSLCVRTPRPGCALWPSILATQTEWAWPPSELKVKESSLEKDLGVHVDKDLRFSQHIETQVIKANKLLDLIRRSYEYLDGSPWRCYLSRWCARTLSLETLYGHQNLKRTSIWLRVYKGVCYARDVG
jgi:hypothetical protein